MRIEVGAIHRIARVFLPFVWTIESNRADQNWPAHVSQSEDDADWRRTRSLF